MPITLTCGTCGSTLEVPVEHAGKQARCPQCNQVSRVPEITAAPRMHGVDSDGTGSTGPHGEPSEAAPTAPVFWSLKTPEGQQYGPVSQEDLQRWVGEGRITNDCELRETGGVWRPADQVFPSLRPHPPSAGSPVLSGTMRAAPRTGQQLVGTHPPTGRRQPVGAQGSTAASGMFSESRPGSVPPSGERQVYMLPDRGALILSLALLGWLSCPILSIAAWVMGTHDLAEMQAGRMDRRGEGTTQAGRVLGMIHGVTLIVAAVVAMFVMLIVFGILGRT
jgi:hypothetical protein